MVISQNVCITQQRYGLGCDYTWDIQQKQTQPTNSYAQPTHPGVSPTQPFDTDPYTDRVKPK